MIQEAATDDGILGAFPVMRQLRPHLEEGEYLKLVRRLQDSGYRLAYAAEAGEVQCVAGFRVAESLAWARKEGRLPPRLRRAEARGAQVLHEGGDEHLRLPLLEGGLM